MNREIPVEWKTRQFTGRFLLIYRMCMMRNLVYMYSEIIKPVIKNTNFIENVKIWLIYGRIFFNFKFMECKKKKMIHFFKKKANSVEIFFLKNISLYLLITFNYF